MQLENNGEKKEKENNGAANGAGWRASRDKQRARGVPAVAQWVKNLTAVPWATVEAQVQSPAWHSELKDPALPQLQRRPKQQLKFNPWPRNIYMPWVQPLKKKKRNKTKEQKQHWGQIHYSLPLLHRPGGQWATAGFLSTWWMTTVIQ